MVLQTQPRDVARAATELWRIAPHPPICILPEAVVEEVTMGKVLVLYDSASGNTARMAGLVAEGAGGIPGMEVRLRR
jgi:hypothetical protein